MSDGSLSNATSRSGEQDTVLEELSAKLGTLEVLLDSLERGKNAKQISRSGDAKFGHSSDEYSTDDGGICFAARNDALAESPAVTYEQDSLEDSLSSSSSSFDSDSSFDAPSQTLSFDPPKSQGDPSSHQGIHQVTGNTFEKEAPRPLADHVPRADIGNVKTKIVGPQRMSDKFGITPIREETSNDKNEQFDPSPSNEDSDHIVSIKHIQYLDTDSEETTNRNSFNESIERLQKIYADQCQIDKRIDWHLSNLWKWAKIDKEKREEVKGEVKNALHLLESEKNQIENLESEMRVARRAIEEQSAPSSWLYFTIALLLLWLCYIGIECNCPYAYV